MKNASEARDQIRKQVAGILEREGEFKHTAPQLWEVVAVLLHSVDTLCDITEEDASGEKGIVAKGHAKRQNRAKNTK